MNRKSRRAAGSQVRTQTAPSLPPDEKLFQMALRLHQAGQLKEAADIYRQILKVNPKHGNSLQNLGAIASNSGQHELAIDLFGRALLLDERNPLVHFNMAIACRSIRQPDRAVVHARRAIALEPAYVDAYLILGLLLEQRNQLSEAMDCLAQAVSFAPDHAAAHTQIGALQLRLGHAAQAKSSLDRAVALDPNYAGAHLLLGNAHFEAGHLQQAVECYLRGITIAPDDMIGHANFCNALVAQSRYAEAIAHYEQVLAYKPDFSEGHCDLATALLAQGEPERALESARRSLRLGETLNAKRIVATCLRNLSRAVDDPDMPDLLVRALSEPWGRPANLVHYCAKHIKNDAAMTDALARSTAAWPARFGNELPFGATPLRALTQNRVLRAMLESAAISDMALERLLTHMRQDLLHQALLREGARHGAAVEAVDDDVLALYAALARQCFITEYVYAVTSQEWAAVDKLRSAAGRALLAGESFPEWWLVALAAYTPLHALPGCEALIGREWSDPVDRLITQQIREPLEEIRLRATIPSLTEIDDEVSKLVRDQYEQNPYPRWVRAPVAAPFPRFDLFLRQTMPTAKFRHLGGTDALEILTAGCGTGQQLFDLTQSLRGARALAVDLSYASLGFAKRQAIAHGLDNIEFGQADIMRLRTLGRTFDIIECGGVLHHLRDPEAGWRVLVSLLRPNGFMRIALYSEDARRHIVAAQQFAAENGYGSSAAEIRRFRQDFLELPNSEMVAQLTSFGDFFSISECRDLLFHVQEQRFTVPRIKAFLDANGLEFVGFDVTAAVRRRYAGQFPDDPAMNSLDNWHLFEKRHPDTFLAMYQFWVQSRTVRASGSKAVLMNRKTRRAARGQDGVKGSKITSVQELLVAATRLFEKRQFGEASQIYQQILALEPNHAESLHHLAVILNSAGRHDMAAELFGRILARNDASPDVHSNMAFTLFRLGRYDQAISHAQKAISIKDDHTGTYLVLAESLEQLGRAPEALAAYGRAASIKPGNAAAFTSMGRLQMQDGRLAEAETSITCALALDSASATAHYQLGNLYLRQGRFQQAIDCYIRAIKLKPERLEAHNNLCIALMSQSRYREAIALYEQLLTHQPDYIVGHCHLAIAYTRNGDLQRALASAKRALKLGDTDQAKTIFAGCLRELPVTTTYDSEMQELLVRAMSEPWDRPDRLMTHGVHLIKADSEIGGCIERASAAWPEKLMADRLFGASGLQPLCQHPVLRCMLENGLIADTAMEKFFTNVRAILLQTATTSPLDEIIENDVLAFYTSLARQCFVNEYAYSISDPERARVEKLRTALEAALRTQAPIAALWVVACAAYVPLYTLEFGAALLERSWPEPVEALLTMQIREPAEESRLRGTIQRLTPIDDRISLLVREQYEEHPYPRWTKTAVPRQKKDLDFFLRLIFPSGHFRSLGRGGKVDLLIAGCGTGQQLFELSQTLPAVNTLAVDLSLASLSYAKRKTEELGLSNIEFGQADILQLAALDRRFDVIECGGVLHHLGDPEAGWRVLASLLRPNGFMRVALYSELARTHVVTARERIAEQGIGRTSDDIRRFRHELMTGSDTGLLREISSSPDFFSISTCRDLLFHVQEHRFTVPRIKAFVVANGLQFTGFEIPQAVRASYAERFPADPAQINLDFWHLFEQDHPGMFAAMYQFWVQKAEPVAVE